MVLNRHPDYEAHAEDTFDPDGGDHDERETWLLDPFKEPVYSESPWDTLAEQTGRYR